MSYDADLREHDGSYEYRFINERKSLTKHNNQLDRNALSILLIYSAKSDSCRVTCIKTHWCSLRISQIWAMDKTGERE